MILSKRLAENVRACFSGIWIQSCEHDDALMEIARLCHDEQWRLAGQGPAGEAGVGKAKREGVAVGVGKQAAGDLQQRSVSSFVAKDSKLFSG